MNIFGKTTVYGTDGKTIKLIVLLPAKGSHLSIHKVTSGGWSITHVPTGRSVLSLSTGIKKKSDAMRICRSLQPMSPVWRNESGSLIWPHFKDVLMRARQQAVQCGATLKTAEEMDE